MASVPGVDQACAWIYRGVWAVLVDIFCVPRRAPDLPAAASADVRRMRPAEGYLRYMKFWFWLLLLPMDLIIIVPWIVVTIAAPMLGMILLVPALALAFAPDVVAYVGIHLKYDTTWYVLSDRSMRLRRGVWSIHETTITYENIQNVTIDQGPVQRWFGIADIVVQTAGGGSEGPPGHGGGGHAGRLAGVADAAALRDLIMARVRASRGAGLGDERHDRPPRGVSVPGGGWSSDHLEALRAIRDELRAAARGSAG